MELSKQGPSKVSKAKNSRGLARKFSHELKSALTTFGRTVVNKFVFLILLTSLAGCASSITKSRYTENNEQLKTQSLDIIDIHAHFINALDLEPGNMTRLVAPRIENKIGLSKTSLRVGNYLGRHLRNIAQKNTDMLSQDNERSSEKPFFNTPTGIILSNALLEQNDKHLIFPDLNDFAEAATTSRQGIALSYIKNYPEVDLVTPSFVDMQGFAEGKRVLVKKYKLGEVVDGEIQCDYLTDVWVKSDSWLVQKFKWAISKLTGKPYNIECAKIAASDKSVKSLTQAYPTTTEKRHDLQRDLAVDFNAKFNGYPAILPMVGFNPMHGVRDSCESFKNKDDFENCSDVFNLFQWNKKKVDHRTGQDQVLDYAITPQDYAKEFTQLFFKSDQPNFIGIKIYPQAGFYPIANCKNIVRRFNLANPNGDMTSSLNVKHLRHAIPYAPLENVWKSIYKVGSDAEDSHQDYDAICFELQKIVDGFCDQGYCHDHRVVDANLGVRLAPMFDQQLNQMWLTAYQDQLPVITHASTAGAKQGRSFDSYGDSNIWEHFEADFTQLVKEQASDPQCKANPLKLLLAHAGSNDDFTNEGFTKTIDLVYKNLLDKGNSCVDFYIDLSNSFLGDGEEESNMHHLLSDKSFRNKFTKILTGKRVLYGSDHFMNALFKKKKPNEFYTNHKAWLKTLGTYHINYEDVSDAYFKEGALEFLGLSNNSKQCQRAMSWFKNEKPEWLLHHCSD